MVAGDHFNTQSFGLQFVTFFVSGRALHSWQWVKAISLTCEICSLQVESGCCIV